MGPTHTCRPSSSVGKRVLRFLKLLVAGRSGFDSQCSQYIFSNGMHFQLTSLLLIMCVLFTIKVISILIKSYLSVTIVLIPGLAIVLFLVCVISFPIIVTMMLVCVPLALYYTIIQHDSALPL